MSVTIISSDEQSLTILKEVATMSVTIKNLLADIMETDAGIPIPNVSGKILEIIFNFCQKEHDIITENQDDSIRGEKLTAFHNEFKNNDIQLINEVLMATNYLDIKCLFDICCQKIADVIKEKSVVELRAIFNIVNDFTPEEEARIIEETAWAEED
jgi:S-phase kinase-associated protein 1